MPQNIDFHYFHFLSMEPLRSNLVQVHLYFAQKAQKYSNICIIRRIVHGYRPWCFHKGFTQVRKYLKMYFLFFHLLIHKQQTARISDSEVLKYEKEVFWNSVRLLCSFCSERNCHNVICQTVKMIFLVNLCWKWSFWRMAHLSLLVRPFYVTNWYSTTCSEYATHFPRNNKEQNEMQT